MYTISKRFNFEAAHCLPHLPPEHQCARLHGHSYRVEVTLASSTLDENSFVVDYGELRALREYIDGSLDHRNLNDVIGPYIGPTTAENIARYLYEWCARRWPETVSVSVSETQKTWATYCPGTLTVTEHDDD